MEFREVFTKRCSTRKLRMYPEVIEKLRLPEGYEILSAFVCGHTDVPAVCREVTDRIGIDII